MMFIVESKITLADFISQKMREQNLSPADVARRAGNQISPATISKIASGEISSSSAKTVALIAEGLNVPHMDLLRLAAGDDIARPLHYQVYAERFDGAELSNSEWQLLEQYFKDYVMQWKRFQRDRTKPPEQLIAESKAKKPKK